MRSRFLILVFLIFFLPLGIFASSGLRITEQKGFFALPLEQFNLGDNPALAYSFWFKINENGGGAYDENSAETGSHILINASPIDENSPVGIWFGHHYVQLSNGRFSASMRTNTNCPGPHFIKENNPIKEEEWHHILVNMKYSNGLYFSIYHNGEKFGETTPGDGITNCNVIDFKNNSCIRIGVPGNYDLNTKQPLDITIDNFQLYNRFFEENEINSLLNQNTPTSLPEGIIGLWNFEENSENMNYLINEVGNNNEVAFIAAGVPIDLYNPIAPDFSDGILSGIENTPDVEENITLPEVFPTEDAAWVITIKQTDSNIWDDFNPGYIITTYESSYYLLGDTIIENKKYSKLYSIYGELDSIKVKSCDFYTEDQLYVGAIRVEGEKVYLRPHEVIYCFGEEMCPHIDCIEEDGYPWYKDEEIDYSFFEKDVLMYDFSVEESERLYIYNYPSSCLHFLATEMRKKGNDHSWIKGIGSTGGLWFNYDFFPMLGSGVLRSLKSFHYKGKQFYPAEETGINKSIVDTPKAKAYVSAGVLYIENAEGITSVEVYNSLGTPLYRRGAGGEDSSLQIALPSTIKGVLIVKVNNEIIKVIK